MSWMGRVFSQITKRQAAGQTAEQLIEKLAASGEKVSARMERAADTPANRNAATHIIGIERWSQRRLRTALGDTAVNDEYDGYRPAADLGMAALAEAFAETREQTVALAQTAAGLPESVTARHNEMGDLSVNEWLVYIENHAARESWVLRR